MKGLKVKNYCFKKNLKFVAGFTRSAWSHRGGERQGSTEPRSHALLA
jgi:hypothetical protein